MSTPGTSLHHQVIQALPWYVRGRLEFEEAGRVEAHLSVCPSCRREAEGLSRMFNVHETSSPPVEVNEEQLERLMDRIDRFEQQRTQLRSTGVATSRFDALLAAAADFLGYLTGRRALMAMGLSATLILGVLAVTVSRAPPAEPSYDVLSSPDPVAGFRVKLRFHAAATPEEVRQLVAPSLDNAASNDTYRIERRNEWEYIVMLERKPDVATLAQWLQRWSSAPNVVEASIDDASQ